MSPLHPTPSAVHRVDGLRAWLIERALPLWLDRGFDRRAGAFHERLDHTANGIGAVPRRMMVQARQIYVYAHGTELGWIDGRERVRSAFDTMIERYYRADGAPGWIFSVDAAGDVAAPQRDLYSHAFVLLAAAWYFRLTGDSQALHLADDTLSFIDERMAPLLGRGTPIVQGEGVAVRQNPLMHLFEAVLALHEATGNAAYLARADEIYGLFRTRLFVPGPDIVAEYFDADWRPIDGARAIWEPGHHLEWGWLLAKYQGLTRRDTAVHVDALIGRAYRDGISPPGIIVDAMRADGTVAKSSRRPWPLTEAAKLNALRHRAGDHAAAGRLAEVLHALESRFLAPAMPGLWFDHLSEAWEPLHDYVPASTLYHLFLGIAEAVAHHPVTRDNFAEPPPGAGQGWRKT